jgi:hypothetical protein
VRQVLTQAAELCLDSDFAGLANIQREKVVGKEVRKKVGSDERMKARIKIGMILTESGTIISLLYLSEHYRVYSVYRTLLKQTMTHKYRGGGGSGSQRS